jgi:hypothetical protein
MSALSASKIFIKGSNISGKVPQLSSLDYRELAINSADGILFTKTIDEKIVSFSNSSVLNSNFLALSGGKINGDIEILDHTKGIILRSPNNSRWRITVTDNGHLNAIAL